MAFIETPRFPDGVAYGAMGGPGYSTDVAAVFGGLEQRNANWSIARRRYELSSGVKTQSDFIAVRDSFHMARGRLHSFRLKDWADYSATAIEGITVLVSGAIYQARKRYGSGTYLEDRDIVKLVSGTIFVFRTRGGVTTDITGATTIDTTTGQFTVTGHVGGDVYTWSGEFDVPVRFDTDQMQPVIVSRSGSVLLLSWESIPLVEVRGE